MHCPSRSFHVATCSQFQQRVWRVHFFCSCRSLVSFLSKLLQLSFCLSPLPELPPFSSCVKGRDCRHGPTLAILLEIGAVVWTQAKVIDVSGRFPLKGVTSVFSSAVCYTGTLCPVRSSTYCSATVIQSHRERRGGIRNARLSNSIPEHVQP